MTAGATMRSEPTIRTPFVRGLLTVSRALGRDPERWLRIYDLPADAESAAEIELPIAAMRRIGDDVASELGDPLLGFHMASVLPEGQLGLIEFLLRNAPTLGDGVRMLIRYSRLINDLTEVTMTTVGDETTVEERLPGEPLAGGAVANEFLLVALTRLVRQLFDPSWRPRRVWFAHPSDREAATLVEFFGTHEIGFGTGANGLAIASADLARPTRKADPALLSVLEQYAASLVAARPVTAFALGPLRDHVRARLPGRPPQLEDVATSLSMSARTLQRRLADHGTSFHALVDDLRRELATSYVADAKVTLGEIAYLLGYSDVRAFLRAFRRWTATTPARYRTAGHRDAKVTATA